LHYMDTHDPFMVHDSSGIGYARARMKNPDPKQYKECMQQAYIAEIEHLDIYLGHLIEGLKKRGLYDDTIFVFVADHGEEFFDHGGWWHGLTLYEEMLRVPLLIKLPGKLQGGVINNDLARLVDIAPTLLQQAGLEPGTDMVGQALCNSKGAFKNEGTAYSFAENDFEGNRQQAVRSLESALIVANEDNPRGVKPVEFYTMTEDPCQQQNIAGNPDFSERVDAMKDIVAQYEKMILEDAPEPVLQQRIDPQLQQQLESLGYL
ncbi:MAG: sulfatase-like hydrolase/transferase, partial [Candidatus Hydrogenedentes bacterium]|nr:sulfatase-like hydrolase/transferase [Candidatus Hydrogenedentota bacterium]